MIQLSLPRHRASVVDPSRCSGCNNFLSQKPASEVTITARAKDLKSNCEECAALNAILKTFGEPRSATADIIIYEDSIGFEDERQQHRELELIRLDNAKQLPDPDSTKKELLGDTGSDEAVRWARERLQKCGNRALHRSCPPILDTKLPTRVIYIVAPEVIRLHINSGDETARYCALSHCWGTRPLVQTKKASLEVFKTGIPWNQLPQTFRDAVLFTYRLGIKYLWIDSLCILQDDVEDWQREGAKMADIYEGSYLTLSATKAQNSGEGCFTNSSAHSFRPVIPGRYGVQLDNIRVRERLNHCEIWRTETEKAMFPVYHRAWTLQEAWLSPRVLHFHPFELVWECHSKFECECSGTETLLIHNSLHFSKARFPQWLGDTERMIEHTDWTRVVEMYASRRLTFEKDIFPALQGLAKRFPLAKTSRYVAGIWEEMLLPGLLWRGANRRNGNYRPHEWRAPTWSWASVTGSVFFELVAKQHQDFVAVASVTVHPLTTDPFGQIKEGRLSLRAPCVDAILCWEIDSKQRESGYPLYSMSFISSGKSISIFDDAKRAPGERWTLYPDYPYDDIGEHSLQSPAQLKVIIMTSGNDLSDRFQQLFCLVLRSVDVSAGTYERVALLTYVKRMDGEDTSIDTNHSFKEAETLDVVIV